MLRNLRRVTTVAAVAVLGVAPAIVTTSAAHAGGAPDNYQFFRAETQWLDHGPVPGLLKGNVHRGALQTVSDPGSPGVSEATGFLEAWTCPRGVEPPALNTPRGIEQQATPCTFTGSRTLTFRSPAVTFGRALSTAHVSGVAIARDDSGHQAPVRLRVDVSWRTTALAERDSFVLHGEDENGNPVIHRVTHVTRESNVSGHVGAIGLGDERSDVTTSEISMQRQVTRPA